MWINDLSVEIALPNGALVFRAAFRTLILLFDPSSQGITMHIQRMETTIVGPGLPITIASMSPPPFGSTKTDVRLLLHIKDAEQA